MRGAYKRFLANCLEKKKPDDIFRCLASLREGHVRALGSSDEEGLASTRDALLRIKKDIVETVHYLIVQSLTGEDAVLSVLDGKKPLFYLRNRGFYKVSQELFGEVIDTIETPGSRSAKERIMKMRELGTKAWQALPGEIRQILNPRSGGHLLISGDSYWSAFPWEGLCFGPGEDDWLGLHRSLCRWSYLTAKGLGGLRRMVFGNGQKTAAVIAPWNAPHTLPLERTRQEAEEIEKKLKGLKYAPSTDRFLYPGEYATRESTAGVFLATPTIIHYTGHGTIFQNEEVLVLWRERSPGEREEMADWAPFGRREITDIKSIADRKKLLEGNPLIMLNACYLGRTREHGGQREDLASVFIEEGAGAVIASPLPVFEGMGVTLGESFYQPDTWSKYGATAEIFMNVRLKIEKEFRGKSIWPAWVILAYHGNPFAVMPHAPANLLQVLSETRKEV